ncbi:MAG: type IV pilus modification PilV family protein [Candidatus Aminicenantales bacterium]
MIKFGRRPVLKNRMGFSLIEALIGIAIMGIAMLGLAQAFLISVNNNTRAGEISHASFLAQQQLDYLRALTAAELNAFPATARGESADQTLDTNGDGSVDFRRITQISTGGVGYAVKILVFPATAVGKTSAALLAAPSSYRVRAILSSVIIR